jgi:hypothetical protein
MTVTHRPVNTPDVGLRRRRGANSTAIFARVKRRFSRLAAADGFIDFPLAKHRFHVCNKRRNFRHRMADRFANAPIHLASPEKSVRSQLRKSV